MRYTWSADKATKPSSVARKYTELNPFNAKGEFELIKPRKLLNPDLSSET